MRGLRARLGVLALACAVSGAAAAEASAAKVLIYTGTVAHRHSEAINTGITPMRDALTAAGIESVWEDCNGYGTAVGQCQHPEKNPRIFTEANLVGLAERQQLHQARLHRPLASGPAQLRADLRQPAERDARVQQ
jgi:hypothetical protein